MLVIISDLHLGDGTCEKSIESSAFRLFTARLEEMAYNASWRTDGKYRPLREINILWLGDILDPLHSTRWLDTEYGDDDYTRPWTDTSAPRFAKKLREITQAILKSNRYAVNAVQNITQNNAILLPPVIGDGQPNVTAREKIVVKVNIHYMVGNHDWVYHLPGEEFDEIRQEIIDAFGLANEKTLFPHELEESAKLTALLAPYKVYARHGDIFSFFSYDKEKGRNGSSMSDLFSLEVGIRFPEEVARQAKEDLSEAMLENLREMSNIRPVLASPLWGLNLITGNDVSQATQNKIKNIWNKVTTDYLRLQKIYYPLKLSQFSLQLALRVVLLMFNSTPFSINSVMTLWAYRYHRKEEEYTLSKYALSEKAFLENKANFIVYGHAHSYEIAALDSDDALSSAEQNKLYFNSGTWRAHHTLARYKPEDKNFVPYQVLTYLAFFKEDQREGVRFETWSGASL